MGGSIIINVLVYTKNGGSPITSSIGLKTNIVDSPKNLFNVYTPSGGTREVCMVVYTPSGDFAVEND